MEKYTYKDIDESMTNDLQSHKIVFSNLKSDFTWEETFPCTVGELIQFLEKFDKTDYIKFQGSDDRNSDYAPYTDTRDLSIVKPQKWSEEEINQHNEWLINEKQRILKLEQEKKQKQEEKDRLEWQRLKYKFG